MMAVGVGFEPTVGYQPTPVFKTGAFNRSATPPLRCGAYYRPNKGLFKQADMKKAPVGALGLSKR